MCASFKSTFTALRGSFLAYLKFSQIKEGATNSAEQLNYLVLPSVFKVLRTQILRHSLDFNAFYMIQNNFFRVLKFLQIKEGGPNFWGKPILQDGWIICSLLLYFNVKSFNDPNSASFIRLKNIPHDAGVRFWNYSNFHKFKRRDLISWGEPILQNGWIIWSLLLYFNFQTFKAWNSSSSIRFQCIPHHSGLPFWDFWNFCKLKSGEGGEGRGWGRT